MVSRTKTTMELTTALIALYSASTTSRTGLSWLLSPSSLELLWCGASILGSWRRWWPGKDSSGSKSSTKEPVTSQFRGTWQSKTYIWLARWPRSCGATTTCSTSTGTDSGSSNTSTPFLMSNSSSFPIILPRHISRTSRERKLRSIWRATLDTQQKRL